jgi:hypothetical protein
MLSKPKKLSLSGSKLTLGNIDASKLRAGPSVGSARKTVQVEVRRKRAPAEPVIASWFDTSEALRTGDITAGICADNIKEVEIIINPMIRNEVFDPVALRRRTEIIRLIKGIKTTGDALGSTILSKDLSPYHQEAELTEEEKKFYSIAFPFFNEQKATLCSPIGAKIILNFLAVFGTEEYIEGDHEQRRDSLVELNTYAQSLNIIHDSIAVEPPTGDRGLAKADAPTGMRVQAEVVKKPEVEPKKELLSLLLDQQTKTPEEVREEKKLRTMFRNRLINATNYRPVCPFTGISDIRFLIASHIKPYAACENIGEKVDPQNGFLLSPNADKLFDCGYISFTDDGVLMMSSKFGVNGSLMASLGLKLNTKVLLKGDRCKEYLAYHRAFVFEGVRTKVKEEK